MIYTIYDGHDAGSISVRENQFDNLVAVPEGLANWALVLPPVWLALHKLWWPLTFYALYLVFILGLLASPAGILSLFIAGLPGLYLWLEGRELCRYQLEAQGMQMVALVEASNEPAAIARYLSQVGQDAYRPVDNLIRTYSTNSRSTQLAHGTNNAGSNSVFGLFTSREL